MDMKMIIGGKHVPASDGAVTENRNPSTGKLIGNVPAATEQDVCCAIDTAYNARRNWRKLALYKKIEIFDKFRALIDKNIDELALLMANEGGKRIDEAYGELKACGYLFRVYGEGARNLYGDTYAEGIEDRVEKDILLTLHEPLGVIACIIPYNYPAELYAHKVASSLITGNTIVIKPASATPMTAIRLTELLLEAEVYPGAINIVTGSGAKIGDWISSNEKIAAISLTGSTRVGAHISKVAADHVPHVFLELGGNDPFIVFEDADLDVAVAETLSGRATNAGQTCCGSKRFLIQNSVKEKYTKKLYKLLSQLKVGDAADRAFDMGPVINERAAKKVIDQIEHTVQQGAKVLLGGKRNGAFIEPTILTDVTPAMDIAKDLEVFGPVFPIIGFDTVDEAIEIANNSIYGLQSGVLTNDYHKAIKIATELETGLCVIGGCGNYRCANQPFGGCKATGTGREGVMATLEEMTHTKAIAFKGVLD